MRVHVRACVCVCVLARPCLRRLPSSGALPQRGQGPAAALSSVFGDTWCARPARDACVCLFVLFVLKEVTFYLYFFPIIDNIGDK